MDYLGKEIPKLGFGLMRLPMNGKDVDIEQTCQMADLFFEHGFTYVDTAYGYLNGKSEEAAKTCIVDRFPRERFLLATKLPAWAGPKTAKEAEDMFYTSLRRTGAGYFDFYLLHNLGDKRTESFDRFGIWDFVAARKEEGLIRHVGFSFHDKAAKLEEALTAHPEVEFVQLQINYADWENLTVESRKCYEVCMKHGKPVVIMEPVKGGILADPPDDVAKLLRDANPEASTASWAVRYAASLDNIVTVLSGMSTLEQMRDNVRTMDPFVKLSEEEQAVIRKAQELLAANPGIPCTNCQYCIKGCPSGLHIPLIFKAMNSYYVYGSLKRAKGDYGWAQINGAKASACVACGQCESVCPQHIQIIDELVKTKDLLEA